jgi:hypothetical protein
MGLWPDNGDSLIFSLKVLGFRISNYMINHSSHYKDQIIRNSGQAE